jgi:hypothetical protein
MASLPGSAAPDPHAVPPVEAFGYAVTIPCGVQTFRWHACLSSVGLAAAAASHGQEE